MNRELIFYEKACTEYYISLVQFIWNTKVSDACLSAAILQFIPSNTYLQSMYMLILAFMINQTAHFNTSYSFIIYLQDK